MTTTKFTFFDTPVGRCSVTWGARGLRCVQLPEARETDTRARLARRFPDAVEAAPPVAVQRSIEAIVALLRGQPSDLSDVALDMEGVPSFHQRVYEVARTIPPGSTLTYGEIAGRLGDRGAARAVGQALGRNPVPIVIPCHRVVASGGRLGGYTGGLDIKRKLLRLEGAFGATG